MLVATGLKCLRGNCPTRADGAAVGANGDLTHRSSPDSGGGFSLFRRDPPIDERNPASLALRPGHISTRFARALDRRGPHLVLTGFHPGESLRKPLVLDDRRVRHALLLVEHPVRQRRAFPAHLQPAVRKLVNLDILADQASGQGRFLKDDPLVVIG
jgi:hypothetical protein